MPEYRQVFSTDGDWRLTQYSDATQAWWRRVPGRAWEVVPLRTVPRRIFLELLAAMRATR